MVGASTSYFFDGCKSSMLVWMSSLFGVRLWCAVEPAEGDEVPVSGRCPARHGMVEAGDAVEAGDVVKVVW